MNSQYDKIELIIPINTYTCRFIGLNVYLVRQLNSIWNILSCECIKTHVTSLYQPLQFQGYSLIGTSDWKLKPIEQPSNKSNKVFGFHMKLLSPENVL